MFSSFLCVQADVVLLAQTPSSMPLTKLLDNVHSMWAIALVAMFILWVARSLLAPSSPTHAEPELDSVPCPKCGRPNSKSTRICPRCEHGIMDVSKLPANEQTTALGQIQPRKVSVEVQNAGPGVNTAQASATEAFAEPCGPPASPCGEPDPDGVAPAVVAGHQASTSGGQTPSGASCSSILLKNMKEFFQEFLLAGLTFVALVAVGIGYLFVLYLPATTLGHNWALLGIPLVFLVGGILWVFAASLFTSRD